MRQKIERDGLKAEYQPEFVIGSGNAAFGYLVRIGDHLFQSPLTYYTKRGVWGMAPGMEQYEHPDFSRPANAECLWCHAGRPRPVDDTLNQYRDPPFELEAISCDRCHGPVEKHLERPSPATIVNPAKLPPARRDSVCEQCHLGGAARILNPGRGFGDFLPSMLLEEVFTVYTYEQPKQESLSNRFKVVGHVEQLALSRCAQAAGERMWCGACHSPHETPTDPVSYYRQRCLGCHEGKLPDDHGGTSRDCVACHMTRRQSVDSGHSAFTDHRIARRPATGIEPSKTPALEAWRKPAGLLAARNLGLANIQIAQRENSRRHLRDGYALLSRIESQFGRDPEVLEALGTALILQGNAGEGRRLLEKAVEAQKAFALRYPSLGAAWWELGAAEEAMATLEEAIRLDPLLESAHHMLAKVYQETGQPEKAEEIWKRYLVHMPGNIYARQALARFNSADRGP